MAERLLNHSYLGNNNEGGGLLLKLGLALKDFSCRYSFQPLHWLSLSAIFQSSEEVSFLLQYCLSSGTAVVKDYSALSVKYSLNFWG